MADHVVAPVEPCPPDGPRFFGEPDTPGCLAHRWRIGDKRCEGCLWNGTRALLDQAVPVVDVLDEANQDIPGEVVALWGELAVDPKEKP